MPGPEFRSQVDVQAPPGLENLGVLPVPQGQADDVRHAWQAEDEQEFNDLVREVTEAVRQDVEHKTAMVVDGLWRKGQRAMQNMQQEQLSHTTRLQSQLEACTEAHRQLEQENAVLLQGLQTVLRHLSAYGGQQPPGAFATGASEEAAPALDAALEGVRRAVDKAASPPPLAETAESPAAASAPADATFDVTLRRADNVPLGLELKGDDAGNCLVVVGIRPGGAVEAWNRQCSGDRREIQVLDSIVSINGVDGIEAMGQECLTKHLLKITIRRRTAAAAAGGSGSQAKAWSFRLDADEFVPKTS